MADIELDELLLAASQDFEEKAIVVEKQHVGVTTRSCRQKQRETPTARFANPTTTDELKEMVQEAVPAKTRQQTKWAVCLWMNWRMHRIKVAQTEEDCPPRLADMSKESLRNGLAISLSKSGEAMAKSILVLHYTRFCAVYSAICESMATKALIFSLIPSFDFSRVCSIAR